MRRATRPSRQLGLLAIATLISCTGCGSLIGRVFDRHDHLPPVYPGVAADAHALTDSVRSFHEGGPLMTIGCAIDMPLSAALDTALLPFDLAIAAGEAIAEARED